MRSTLCVNKCCELMRNDEVNNDLDHCRFRTLIATNANQIVRKKETCYRFACVCVSSHKHASMPMTIRLINASYRSKKKQFIRFFLHTFFVCVAINFDRISKVLISFQVFASFHFDCRFIIT